MRKKVFSLLLTALLAISTFTLPACSEVKRVKWSELSANGIFGVVTTTELTFVFDNNPGDLSLDNITVTGAEKVELSGNGKTRTLTVRSVTSEYIIVKLTNPKGYVISPAEREVNAAIQAPVVQADFNIKYEVEENTLFSFECTQSGWYEFYSSDESNMNHFESVEPYCYLYNQSFERLAFNYGFLILVYLDEGETYYLCATVSRFDSDFIGGRYLLNASKYDTEPVKNYFDAHDFELISFDNIFAYFLWSWKGDEFAAVADDIADKGYKAGYLQTYEAKDVEGDEFIFSACGINVYEQGTYVFANYDYESGIILTYFDGSTVNIQQYLKQEGGIEL